MLGALKKLPEELYGWDFVCFHKYYLINLKLVTPIGPEIAILDNEIEFKCGSLEEKESKVNLLTIVATDNIN